METSLFKDSRKLKILYGICGIGNGHFSRQQYLLNHFLKEGHQIIIFSYGSTLETLKSMALNLKNLRVVEVQVPFYCGNKDGLDFAESAKIAPTDSVRINCQAKAMVQEFMGRPDFAITDYEPVSAQLSYAYNCPLITLDQQSKYLYTDYFKDISGTGVHDEVMRLRLFFPKADLRIACSFFDLQEKNNPLNVKLCPPILRSEVMTLDQNRPRTDSILIYLSEQHISHQSIAHIIDLIKDFPTYQFHLFVPSSIPLEDFAYHTLYHHGHSSFHQILSQCKGIISTAGHGLLSEAMHIEIPVLAIPLKIYEQQMSAKMIHDHGFGLKVDTLDPKSLNYFLENLNVFADNIHNDKTILLRSKGIDQILSMIYDVLGIEAQAA